MTRGTKKPVQHVSKKRESSAIDPGFTLSAFDLEEGIKEELKGKGLVGRFINLKMMENYGGRHPKGWVPYKRDIEDLSDYAQIFGKDPDGYVRRGDLILGVKKEEEVERHKAYLAQEAKKQEVRKVKRRNSQVLRDYIRDVGMDKTMKLIDGYDD